MVRLTVRMVRFIAITDVKLCQAKSSDVIMEIIAIARIPAAAAALLYRGNEGRRVGLAITTPHPSTSPTHIVSPASYSTAASNLAPQLHDHE